MKNIKDSEFIRGEVPMTKFNIRSLSIAHLQIEKGDKKHDGNKDTRETEGRLESG